jgi:hypothetical protein
MAGACMLMWENFLDELKGIGGVGIQQLFNLRLSEWLTWSVMGLNDIDESVSCWLLIGDCWVFDNDIVSGVQRCSPLSSDVHHYSGLLRFLEILKLLIELQRCRVSSLFFKVSDSCSGQSSENFSNFATTVASFARSSKPTIPQNFKTSTSHQTSNFPPIKTPSNFPSIPRKLVQE